MAYWVIQPNQKQHETAIIRYERLKATRDERGYKPQDLRARLTEATPEKSLTKVFSNRREK